MLHTTLCLMTLVIVGLAVVVLVGCLPNTGSVLNDPASDIQNGELWQSDMDQANLEEMAKALVPIFFAEGGLEEQIARMASGEDQLGQIASELTQGNLEEASALLQAYDEADAAEGNPWHLFFLAEIKRRLGDKDEARRLLRSAAEQPQVESRFTLWAWNALRDLGDEPDEATGRELLGVVFEVPMEFGVDLLAVYADGRARYINQSGHMLFWEAPEEELEKQLINDVMTIAQPLVENYPIRQREEEPPPADRLRITFLTRRGYRVAEANQNETGDLEKLLMQGALVMRAITERAVEQDTWQPWEEDSNADASL